jgi:hypothetical protein
VAYNDLREWIAALDKAGELKRITGASLTRLEITEITDRVSKPAADRAPSKAQLAMHPAARRCCLKTSNRPSRPQSPHQPVRLERRMAWLWA